MHYQIQMETDETVKWEWALPSVECFNPFSKLQVLRKEQTIRLHYVPRPDWEVAR